MSVRCLDPVPSPPFRTVHSPGSPVRKALGGFAADVLCNAEAARDLLPVVKPVLCNKVAQFLRQRTGIFEFVVQTTIGVTGPTRIQLRRSDSVNGSRPTETLTLDRGRNWVFLDRISVHDPSKVWFRAEVSGPNTIAAQASAKVDCVATGP